MDPQLVLLTMVVCTLFVSPDIAAMDKENINDELKLYRKNYTWEGAFNFCQDKEAVLAVPKEQEYNDVQSALQDREQSWVGQYTYTTPWMYPTGCFKSDKPPKRLDQTNDIATCKRECGDSDIMLNINNCLCVSEVPDVSTRQPSSLCKTRCPGNPEDVCGGEEVYQHYTTFTGAKQDRDENYMDNCGMLEKRGNQPLSVFARHCDMNNTFLCALYDNKTNGIPFYIPKDKNGSLLYLPYQKALDSCVNNGGYLADPSKLKASQFQSGLSTQYWVGARRRTIYVESVDELPENAENQKCLYMKRGSYGVTKDRAQNCTTTASFLCRKDRKGESITISIASTTFGIVTSPAPATTGTTITNGTSPSDVSSERTGSTSTSTTNDPVNQGSPATETDWWPYIGGGAGFFIAVIIILIIVIISLTRRRRNKSKLPTDVIPLDIHNYDYLDIMVAENPEDTNGREDGCVESGTGPKSTSDEAKLSLNLNSASAFSKSVQPRDSKEKRSNDLYDLADPTAGSVGDDTYNELHATHTSHTGNVDALYDHANMVASDECYHEIARPGCRHREEDSCAYDSTQNTLDSDVYNTLSDKGLEVNGKETYNPYVETHIDPLP